MIEEIKKFKFYSRITIGFMILGVVIQVLAFFDDGLRLTIIGSVCVGIGLVLYIIFFRKLRNA